MVMNTNNSRLYSLRAGIASDIPFAIAIWQTAIESSSNLNLPNSAIEQQVRILHEMIVPGASGGFWVAETPDQIIGWQSLAPTNSNDSRYGHANVMSSTYITRRSGDRDLGSKLVECAIQYALSSDISLIFAYIAETNVASQRLARLHGFKMLGTFPKISGWSDGEPLQYWFRPTTSET